MKHWQKNKLIIMVIFVQTLVAQAPPYSGTIFIEPGIITDTDCSTFSSITYAGQENKLVYDRRANNWVTINAFLFDVVWNDSLISQAVVNPEFSLAEATAVAQKYAIKIGQLPYCLRTDVHEIWIHKGDHDWGGGNNSILIHTDRSAYYESQGIAEETLVHEASHTSLDASHAGATEWISAQSLDNHFISTYAQQASIREDIAESFLTWLAVRYYASRISEDNYNIITQTIPNRLLYFDAQNFTLNPIPCLTTSLVPLDAKQLFRVHPNLTDGIFYIESTFDDDLSITIFNAVGQQINKFSRNGNLVSLSAYPDGVYFILINNVENVASFRVIKAAKQQRLN